MNTRIKLMICLTSALSLFSSLTLAEEVQQSQRSQRVASIETFAKTTPRDQAAFLKQLLTLNENLPASLKSSDGDGADFVHALSSAIQHVARSYTKENSLKSSQTAKSLATLFIKVDALIKPADSFNYKPQDVYQSIESPEGPNGTPPSAIKDPEKRKLYEAAIAKNVLAIQTNDFYAAVVEEVPEIRNALASFLLTSNIEQFLDKSEYEKLKDLDSRINRK